MNISRHFLVRLEEILPFNECSVSRPSAAGTCTPFQHMLK